MHNIGNAHDARTILEWVRDHDTEDSWRPSCVEDRKAPEGWEYVGAGSARSVWRSPEGVGYKVSHRLGYGQCAGEIRKLKEVWEKGAIPGVGLPLFSSFTLDEEIVVAIELIDGVRLIDYHTQTSNDEAEKYYILMHKVETTYSLWDMHDENCVVEKSTGNLVPVDFG